jgi:photosystem II stability/assembly factor-like uncharacterized protein
MYRSVNNGDLWTEIINGLTNTNTQALTVDPLDHVVAGTSDGAFLTVDNGDTWSAINEGLTTSDVRSLTVDQDGHVLAGTGGGGVFRLEQPAGVGELPSASRFGMENLPNPCVGSTVIRYRLPERTHVELVVRDAQGRQVALLTDAERSAGTHATAFDVARLDAGIYFYSLITPGGSDTQRMVVVRAR